MNVAWVVACAALGFIWILTAVSLAAIVNGGHVDWGVAGEITITDGHELAVWAISGTVICVGVMSICSNLRGVFDTLVAGDPFVPENARRLRIIALTLAAMEVARMFLSALVQVVLMSLKVSTAKDGAKIEFGLDLSMWVAVLTLLVLSQVFAEGARLREEQKMTI